MKKSVFLPDIGFDCYTQGCSKAYSLLKSGLRPDTCLRCTVFRRFAPKSLARDDRPGGREGLVALFSGGNSLSPKPRLAAGPAFHPRFWGNWLPIVPFWPLFDQKPRQGPYGPLAPASPPPLLAKKGSKWTLFGQKRG